MCSFGLARSKLTVLPVERMTTSGQPAATIMDHQPMVNIQPLGMCTTPDQSGGGRRHRRCVGRADATAVHTGYAHAMDTQPADRAAWWQPRTGQHMPGRVLYGMGTYSQSTGYLNHNGRHTATGYSGHGDGKNNPSIQNAPNAGPYPQGRYQIGPPMDDNHVGPFALPLTPTPGTDTFGRFIRPVAPLCELTIDGEKLSPRLERHRVAAKPASNCHYFLLEIRCYSLSHAKGL
jgi:hypothetical protein